VETTTYPSHVSPFVVDLPIQSRQPFQNSTFQYFVGLAVRPTAQESTVSKPEGSSEKAKFSGQLTGFLSSTHILAMARRHAIKVTPSLFWLVTISTALSFVPVSRNVEAHEQSTVDLLVENLSLKAQVNVLKVKNRKIIDDNKALRKKVNREGNAVLAPEIDTSEKSATLMSFGNKACKSLALQPQSGSVAPVVFFNRLPKCGSTTMINLLR
jgi:hypothetical protein